MRSLDFSSWQALLSTMVGLSVITLIAAYKTLGGSFTGELGVDPAHWRELRQLPAVSEAVQAATSDRTRRICDAVEAALSDEDSHAHPAVGRDTRADSSAPRSSRVFSTWVARQR